MIPQLYLLMQGQDVSVGLEILQPRLEEYWLHCVHHPAHTAVLWGKEITECKTMFEKNNVGHYNATQTTSSNTAGLGTAALVEEIPKWQWQAACSKCVVGLGPPDSGLGAVTLSLPLLCE